MTVSILGTPKLFKKIKTKILSQVIHRKNKEKYNVEGLDVFFFWSLLFIFISVKAGDKNCDYSFSLVFVFLN